MLKVGLDFFLCDSIWFLVMDSLPFGIVVLSRCPGGNINWGWFGANKDSEAERWTLEGETVMGDFLRV